MIKIRTIGALLLAFASLAVQAEDDFLKVDDAFKVSAKQVGSNSVELQWTVAEGYYLYKDKFNYESLTPEIALADAGFPEAVIKDDPYFGKVAIFKHSFDQSLPFTNNGASTLQLKLTYQGCASAGLCYPPQRKTLEIALASSVAASSALPFGQTAVDSPWGKFLPPEQAFVSTIEATDTQTLLLHWEIADGYYIYKDKFQFSVDGNKEILEAKLPAGTIENDPEYGSVEVYKGTLDIPVVLKEAVRDGADVLLKVKFQGCAKDGLCYPPMERELFAVTQGVSAPSAKIVATSSTPTPTPTTKAVMPSATQKPQSEQDKISDLLTNSSLTVIFMAMFGVGLLLAFTACIYPMIPILTGIITGHSEKLNPLRGFMLSLTYVVAMASALVIVVLLLSLFKFNIQAATQNPYVLIPVAILFVGLALSMFGFYDLQLPSSLQSRLTEVSNKQQGGTYWGVAVMGFLSAFIVGPCTTPGMIGVLAFMQVSDSNMAVGGLAMFAMGLGMGAPLLVVGAGAGTLLPKAGAWMMHVKAAGGVLLIGVAILFFNRVVPDEVGQLIWAGFFIATGVYLGALEPIREGASNWYRLWKGMGVFALLIGAIFALKGLGVATPAIGASISANGTAVAAANAELKFERVTTLTELQTAVASSTAAGKPVMFDFYADWCVACKEFEHETFVDPSVQSQLRNVTLLQADITAMSDADQEILDTLNVVGPPTLIFYGANGSEISGSRVVGFQKPSVFSAHLDATLGETCPSETRANC